MRVACTRECVPWAWGDGFRCPGVPPGQGCVCPAVLSGLGIASGGALFPQDGGGYWRPGAGLDGSGGCTRSSPAAGLQCDWGGHTSSRERGAKEREVEVEARRRPGALPFLNQGTGMCRDPGQGRLADPANPKKEVFVGDPELVSSRCPFFRGSPPRARPGRAGQAGCGVLPGSPVPLNTPSIDPSAMQCDRIGFCFSMQLGAENACWGELTGVGGR